MSYNPHDYKHLFKRGLFDYPSRELSNWDESHRLFALNQEPFCEETKILAPGLVLKKGHIKFREGFSNYVIFEVDTKLRRVETHYCPKSDYPLTAFKKLGDARVVLNLGYYYLTTHEHLDKVKPPRVRVCNLAIYRGKIINLPIIDRSAFLVMGDGSVKLALVRACGKLAIGKKTHTWSGSKTGRQSDVVVFNNSNIAITNVNHPVIGPFRTPNRTYVIPKKGKKYLPCAVRGGKVRVLAVKHSKLLIRDYDVILEVNESLVAKRGDVINFLAIDGMKFGEIKFAVSIGPILKRTEKERLNQVGLEGLDCDPFLSNCPHREEASLARACLVDLGGGKLATVSIDGIPQAGSIYPGVTPGQLAEFVCSVYPRHKIAVCTDPSNTVKAIYVNGKKTHVFGNTHYLAYRKLKNGGLKFWPNGQKGRKIHTMLVIK